MFDIPIITYHKISNQKEFGLTTVSKRQFEIQMKYLKSNGYTSVCFKDLTQEYSLPEKPIIITFDDGYESIYQNAFPILKKYKFLAIVYIVTDYIGRFNLWEAAPFQQKFRHLSEAQILELKNQGHEIASHSKLHRYLPALSINSIKEEIEVSKTNLEALLGEKITSFCYPYGRFSEKIINIVEDAGYRYATSNLRLSNKNNNNPYSLSRRSIYMTDSLNTFKSKLATPTSLNVSYFSEILIQKGALASIGINLFRRARSHF